MNKIQVVRKSQFKYHNETTMQYIQVIANCSGLNETCCMEILWFVPVPGTTSMEHWKGTQNNNRYFNNPQHIFCNWYWGYDLSWWDEEEKENQIHIRDMRISKEEWEKDKHNKVDVFTWLNNAGQYRNKMVNHYYGMIALKIMDPVKNYRQLYIHDSWLQLDDEVYRVEHMGDLNDRDGPHWASQQRQQWFPDPDHMDLFVTGPNNRL